ncbi:MAG TPA: tetratricopeptide repeat protein [Candidatus Caenarcaniphilales bacterium]|nr:tetratricopeptide repeat protein [Candidatus Caenarcaniphilales bacterium]
MKNRALRRLWFPSVLALVVAVVFVALGPLSGSPTAAERLAALAPPGADSTPFSAPPDASPTEREIAKQYETIRQFPDTVGAYVLLGNAYLQHVREKGDPSDYGRAEAAFDEALKREPNNVDALIGKGVLELARHDFAAALALGQQAVTISPHTARAHGVVVDALTELGRYDEALASTQTMVDLRPDLASFSRVSYQRELRGNIDGAIDAMSRAYDMSVGTSVENREYTRVLIGDLHLLKGDAATAEQIYHASLQTSPGFVWALVGLGRTEAARGDLDAAIAHYQQAVDTIPLPEFLIALGEAQEAAGLETEARQSYELVQAIRALFAENGVNVDLELALFEANHGDPAAAAELAGRAYAVQPNVKAADALGWALHRAGRSEEAQRYADEALGLGAAYGPFHFHAGMIALELGDEDAARGHLAKALEAAPTLAPLDLLAAQETLEQLGG